MACLPLSDSGAQDDDDEGDDQELMALAAKAGGEGEVGSRRL